MDFGESTYRTERVRRSERNEERAKWSREDQTESTEEINAEIGHAMVLNRGLDRRLSGEGEEGRAEGAATYKTFIADDRGEDYENRVWWTGWSWWFGGKGWASSKWKNKYYNERVLPTEDEVGRRVEDDWCESRVSGPRRTRSIAISENLTSFPFSAHTGGCAVWWGQMSWRFSSTLGKVTIILQGNTLSAKQLIVFINHGLT